MSGYVCHDCGNPATAAEVRFRGNDLVHIGDCPPMPDGWHPCRSCDAAAAPGDQVPFVELWEIDWEIRELLVPRQQPAHVPLPPRFVTRVAGTTGLNEVPEGAAGVAEWEPDFDGTRPMVVCRECAQDSGWSMPPSGSRAQASGQVGEPEPEDALEHVPTDGEWRSIEDTVRLAGYGLRNGKPVVRQWARDGILEVTERPTGAGGSNRKMYRRPVS